MRRVPAVALVATLFVGGACSSGSTASSSLPVIVQAPDDPSRPYGIVEIDYHFHDAHPSLPLLPDRTVRWTNEGAVVHNVTFPTIGFSRNLQVGKTFSIQDLGRKLGGPGTYTFYCKFHQTLGMVGTIVIVAPGSIPTPSPTG